MMQAAPRLLAWSRPEPVRRNLFEEYKTEDNIHKRILKKPVGPLPSLLDGDVHEFFRDFLEIPWGEESTTEGFMHNDLHGGNLLLDVQGNVWLIDYATAKDGPGLNDFAKLLCSTLLIYLEAVPDDEAAFEELARRLASVPSMNTGFVPIHKGASRMSRVEAVGF